MTIKREESLLQQALTAARAKHELTARDLFLEVVEINPRNELAWMWLTGLLDDLDDCIYACEQVLAINPRNEQIRRYLVQLQHKKQKQLDEQRQLVAEQVQRAGGMAKAGQRESALGLIREAAQMQDPGVDGWRLLAELSPEMDEQIHALKKMLALTPQDVKARETLNRLSHLQRNPQELAALYEEQGKIEKAIEQYYLALRQPELKDRWRSIDRKIVRLKERRSENIAHVSPRMSIARLAAGPPLLYFFMLLIHVGINPLAEPAPLLWLEFLIALFGGGLVAFASVRLHHRLWFVLFKDISRAGSSTARLGMAAVGWTLIVLPFLHLFFASFRRFFAIF